MEEHNWYVILDMSISISQGWPFIETNIMVGTHADSLLAEAVLKGFGAGSTDDNEIQPTFNVDELTTIWEAAWKDASVPPVDDDTVSYADREEVSLVSVTCLLLDLFPVLRVSITKCEPDCQRFSNSPRCKGGSQVIYMQKVSVERWIMRVGPLHSLVKFFAHHMDYIDDDHAVAVLSTLISPELIKTPNLYDTEGNASSQYNVTTFLNARASYTPWTVWNPAASAPAVVTGGEDIKGFVQARQQNGTWSGKAHFVNQSTAHGH